MNGAGGTPGGVLNFIVGLAMVLGGLFTLASHITVGLGFGYNLYTWGGYGINAGSLLLVFMVGVGMLFFNGKSIIGWIVILASLGAILVGVIMNLRLHVTPMSLLDIVIIMVLIGGGFGLFIKSLKSS